jgi:hypothetical protein
MRDGALAPAPPEAEGELLDARHHRQALGAVDEAARNGRLLHRHELLEHIPTGQEALVLLALGPGRRSGEQAGNEQGRRLLAHPLRI